MAHLDPHPGPPATLPPGLAHVRDLEAFDGPILSEFRDGAGAVWLLKWATCDDAAHRWLMVKSTPENVVYYLAGAISMHTLLSAAGDAAMLVDYDGAEARGAWTVSLSDPVIRRYLPEPTAMHDPELRPEADS